MKKILILDFCTFKGHHESYFMMVLSVLSTNGYYVFSNCADNQKLKENIYSQDVQNCQVIDLNLSSCDKLLRRSLVFFDRIIQNLPFRTYFKFAELCNLIATNRLLDQIGEKIPVFFVHLDSVLPPVSLFISRKFLPKAWSGIYIHPSYRSSIYFGHTKSRQKYFAEKNFNLESCKSILVLDSEYQVFFKKACPQRKFLLLPELSLGKTLSQSKEEKGIVKSIRDGASGRIIISVLGALTRRKNLLLFLEVASKIDLGTYYPVIVGQLYIHEYSQEELDKINELSKKLNSDIFVRTNYHIPDETEFDDLICLSDIIYAQYHNHPFSSNILIKAMMHRKPVIVNPGYLMEKVVKRYNWKAVSREDHSELVDAISSCARKFKINEESYKRFRLDYSKGNFEGLLLQGVSCLDKS